jgi:Major Facilitator Superfamily/Biotin-lipoyl like
MADRRMVKKPAPAILRRLAKGRTWWVLGALALIVAAVVGLRVFAHVMSFESTDDAFISVHYTLISSKVAGRVSKVNIDDNQEVKKGDILVEFDPRDFDAALEQKAAALKASVAQAEAARASLGQAIAAVGVILYGTTAVLPQFLESLLGYTAFQTGVVMSPRGIGAMIGSFISGRIISKIDARKWQVGGVLLLALAMWWYGGFDLNINPSVIIIPVIISGFGITHIFVPMSTLSVASIPREKMGDATGITSLLRNLGGSIGISLMTTFVARDTQVHQALLVSLLTPFNPPFRQQLSGLQDALAPLSAGTTAHHQAYGVIYSILQQQAALLAYVDMFRILAMVCLVCIPAVLLFRKPQGNSTPALSH